MKKNEYLLMLFQDNETETEPKKELHSAVLECTVEALSQSSDDFEIDGKIGLTELFDEILKEGKSRKKNCVSPAQASEFMANCVSPFQASELIAKRLGVTYVRPINKLKATFGGSSCSAELNLEDFL